MLFTRSFRRARISCVPQCDDNNYVSFSRNAVKIVRRGRFFTGTHAMRALRSRVVYSAKQQFSPQKAFTTNKTAGNAYRIASGFRYLEQWLKFCRVVPNIVTVAVRAFNDYNAIAYRNRETTIYAQGIGIKFSNQIAFHIISFKQ